MRVLTYNLWHGLAPSSPISMTALEPSSRLKKRLKLQFELLNETPFDVGFFQEVNPLLDRSHVLSRSLKKDLITQSDLVGVKVLGLGLPGNLNSGLMILASESLQMRKVQGLKLSGQGTSLVSPWLSVQFREERFALIGEILTPNWGRVLVVNAHLHHGLEWTESLDEDLKKLGKDLSLSSAVQAELMERVKKGNERRLREVRVLLNTLSKLSARYSMVIVGGDFNARPDGELAALFQEFEYKDSYQGQGDLFTFDPVKNKANHMLQARFPLSVKFDDLTFSDQVRAELQSTLTRHETSARRIDQIWIQSKTQFQTKTELIGLPAEDGFAPSDHFGYLVTIS